MTFPYCGRRHGGWEVRIGVQRDELSYTDQLRHVAAHERRSTGASVLVSFFKGITGINNVINQHTCHVLTDVLSYYSTLSILLQA